MHYYNVRFFVICTAQICSTLNCHCDIFSCSKITARALNAITNLLSLINLFIITKCMKQTDGVPHIESMLRAQWRKSNGRRLANVPLWKLMYIWLGKCKSVRVHHIPVDTNFPGNSMPLREAFKELIRRR